MKNRCFLFLAALVSMLAVHPSAFGQGTLTPPGAPSPTMKTLDQIEPRTRVPSLPFTISAPGSYYLTTNLVGVSGNSGITISSGNVTLDLNGFSLTGVPGSLSAIIFSAAQTNVTIRNGSMSGWGADGVNASSGPYTSRNLVCENLTIYGNTGSGIRGLGLVRSCLCSSNQLIGIYNSGGLVEGCEANYNKNVGILMANGTVRDCRAINNASHGIVVQPGTVTGSWVENNGHSGIYVNFPNSKVIGNTCNGNNTIASASDAGIYVNDTNNRIEDNHVAGSGLAGIKVDNVYNGNIVIKNSVSGNGANNYVMPGSQIVGPLISTFGTITNANPWANFSY